MPEHFRKRATISGDLRRSPDIFEAFPSFGRLTLKYLSLKYFLHTSVVNVWSEALSCLFFQVYY